MLIAFTFCQTHFSSLLRTNDNQFNFLEDDAQSQDSATMLIVRTKMRSRLYFIACVFLTAICTLFMMTGNRQQSFKTIVKETKVQIVNLKKNFDDTKWLKVDPKIISSLGLAEEIRKERHDDSPEVEEERYPDIFHDLNSTLTKVFCSISKKILKPLLVNWSFRFRVPVKYWPSSPWHVTGNASEPVVVTAVVSGRSGDAVHFIRNTKMFLPNATVIMYDMGLNSHERDYVIKYCNYPSLETAEEELKSKDPDLDLDGLLGSISKENSSTSKVPPPPATLPSPAPPNSSKTIPPDESMIKESNNSSHQCILKKFDVDGKLPAHTRKSAYRPIIIQEVLKDAGCVLWMDIDQRFTTGDLKPFLTDALEQGGVSAWLEKQRDETIPTSSLTHPKMFPYLGIHRVEDFNFQHMVSLHALLVYNFENVSKTLMRPWVKCSLVEGCIEPIGAQASGCRFDKKPKFRYSGCHAYDVSALNLLLGQLFKFQEGKYVRENKFFATVTDEPPEQKEVGNSTTTTKAATGIFSNDTAVLPTGTGNNQNSSDWLAFLSRP